MIGGGGRTPWTDHQSTNDGPTVPSLRTRKKSNKLKLPQGWVTFDPLCIRNWTHNPPGLSQPLQLLQKKIVVTGENQSEEIQTHDNHRVLGIELLTFYAVRQEHHTRMKRQRMRMERWRRRRGKKHFIEKEKEKSEFFFVMPRSWQRDVSLGLTVPLLKLLLSSENLTCFTSFRLLRQRINNNKKSTLTKQKNVTQTELYWMITSTQRNFFFSSN